MYVYTKRKGKISLDKREFVGQGGQGSVYAKARTAFKVYTDPQMMLPVKKIEELSVLNNPNVLRPLDVLFDSRNRPVGYTMRYVRDTQPLCRLFTKSFKVRHGVDTDKVIELVQQMQETVQHVHNENILIVDLNEMNFLLDKKLERIFFIDVDSYQTPSFPATAIMENIRDRHSKKFSENTDWFSFGIVSFQMFIGIHPYKGKHPKVKTLEARMDGSISVLSNEVSIPAICPPFDVIPDAYRRWYEEIFENGQRLPPPFKLVGAVQVTMLPKKITGGDKFEIKEFRDFDSPIAAYWNSFGKIIVTTSAGLFVNGKEVPGYKSDMVLGSTPKLNHVIGASVGQDKLGLYDFDTRRQINCDLSGSALMSYGGRIYVHNNLDLYELEFIELGQQNIHVSPRIVANVMEKATTLFDGVAMQNMLGAHYACVFPESGQSYQIHLTELDEYRVINAKYENRVLMVVTHHGSCYDCFVFRLYSDFSGYDVRKIEDVQDTALNFIVLENGICVSINDEEDIELCLNKPNSQDSKLISDPAIKGIQLYKDGLQTMFSRGNKLFSLSMK